MRQYRRPHQFRRKQPILLSPRFWLAVFVSAAFCTLFYFLLFADFFQVDRVVVTNEKRVSKEELKEFVESRLEKKLLFFPTRSIILINSGRIEKEALNHFPPIAKIEIKRSFPKTLNVIIVERLEKAIWCQAEECFLLDGEGIVFEKTETQTSLLLVKGQEESRLSLGEKVIDKDLLLKIVDAAEKLTQALRVEVGRVLVLPEYFQVETPEGWLILFNPAGDLDWQLVKLEAVLAEKIPRERRRDLEYIDLRFGNFAPYKYKD